MGWEQSFEKFGYIKEKTIIKKQRSGRRTAIKEEAVATVEQ